MRRLKSWLQQRWWAWLRALDLHILWPQIKAQAPDLIVARAAFLMHAGRDRAWREFYTADQLAEFTTTLG